MKIYIKSLVLVFILVLFNQCQKPDPYDYEIEYQDGYPSNFAGQWVAFDFLTFTVNGQLVPIDLEYDLITALDPNNEHYLIIDNIYNASLRVRAFVDIAGKSFYATSTEQLDQVNGNDEIKTISIRGDYIEDDEGDILQIQTGLYDQYNDLYDTIITLAFRKDGLEDVEEYQWSYYFDN